MGETSEVLHEIGTYVCRHFRETGTWPRVRKLQHDLRRLGFVPRIAAEAGRELMICEPSSRDDSVCYLTLRGLEVFAPDDTDVRNFLAIARLAAARAASAPGETPRVHLDEIASELGISMEEARRAGDLVYRFGSFTNERGGPGGDDEYSFRPAANAWYYESVQDLAEFEAAEQKEREDRLAESRLMTGWTGSEVPASPSEDGTWYHIDAAALANIVDPGLAEVLRQDLREIETAGRNGAWKAVGLLAGSCCEGVLVDILGRDAKAVEARLGPDWRDSKGLETLAKTARQLGLISEDMHELARLHKRWRDLIHPHRAAQAAAPRRETARTLVSVLGLLLAELAVRARSVPPSEQSAEQPPPQMPRT